MSPLKHLLAITFACAAVLPSQAQEAVRWSGLVYMDYEYLLSSSDEDAEGQNGFEYRRMYLTADYKLSDEFSGRARLEAKSEPGTSYPFVKDLYLKWKGAIGDGHDLKFGVQSPPVFTVSEKHWGYRSLEKTIMDRQKIVSSRDFGLAANGKLTSDGDLTYGVMVGNDNSVRGETDKNKRVYGQIAWQPDNIAVSVGGDFASGQDRTGVNANAFAGYTTDEVRVGAEGFFQSIDLDNSERNLDKAGISVWIVKPIDEKVEAVGRLDYVENDNGLISTNETFVIVGAAYSPNPKVHLIPNIYVVDFSGSDDPEIAGRFTVHADF